MGISLIWAMDQNGLVGKGNDLPWRLPNDMNFFKQNTKGKTVVMGRKTWESLRVRPLPGRRNIVLTGDRSYKAEGAEVMHSVDEVLEIAKDVDLMIIGGGSVYGQFIPHADRLFVTRIDAAFEGDVHFPPLDWSQFALAEEIPGIRDEKNVYDHRFMIYERRKG
ncbi:dihydrofolate reductase [Paenibacillus sp. FSL W8-0186]|uniref:Dihydrofolate reductase n=1 Tax=Paenibacillus woosongensis TaxID=307580 RepID=A0ABQ4MU05_9BACL|nr:dihydrofolate reductase [Paenibacillus woosongensis]GIP59408.1 dihydrofolate reductase [Paenibacillus woosongensis]